MCSYYFSSVSFAEWPPFGKWLLTQLTICYLCILTICNISYFPFLVLRAAGVGFLLLQFLIFAYVLLSKEDLFFHNLN